jgi:hypothetical protein
VAPNGNDRLNQVYLSATVSGVKWLNDTQLALRWNAVYLPGQDYGLAIDNFSLSVVPKPGSMALVGLMSSVIVFAQRRLSSL